MIGETPMKILKTSFIIATLFGTINSCGSSAQNVSLEPDRLGPPPNVQTYDHWEKPEQFKARVAFGNVKADDMATLFSNVVEVGAPWNARVDSNTDLFVYVIKSTKVYGCNITQQLFGDYYVKPITVNVENYNQTGFGSQHPMNMSSMSPDFKDPAFTNVYYDAKQGRWAAFTTNAVEWEETSYGHLQYDIPAAVYEACPEFPSAASLGMKINQKQTATTYPELLAQDPGRRVLRPDLVSEQAYGPYDPSKPRRF